MGLGIAGASLIGLMTSAVRVGQQFQTQLMFTAQVAGATGEQMRGLEELARRVGRTTQFSAAQAAESMYTFASAGYSATEMMKAIIPTMQLAGGQLYDLGGTTEMVVSSLKMFGMSTSQTTRVVDAFTIGNIRSLLTMEKLRYALGYAGPVAYGFGMSIEECVNALGAFANLGLEGSRIGVGFRMMMKEAGKATLEKVKALQKYKLTMEDINPGTKKFIGILQTVAKVSMTVSDALKVFGARTGAYVVAMASMLKSGEMNWDKEMQEFVKGAGKTQALYENMMKSWQNQWQITKNVIGDVLISIFNKFSTSAISGLAKLQNALRVLSKEIEINGGFVTQLGILFNQLVDGFGAFVARARDIANVFQTIVEAAAPLMTYATLGWGFAKLAKGIAVFKAGTLNLKPVLSGATKQIGMLSTAFNWFINGLLIADFSRGGKRAADTAMVLEGSLQRMAMGGIATGKAMQTINFQHFVAQSTRAVQASRGFNIIKESVLALGIAFSMLAGSVKAGVKGLLGGAITLIARNWVLALLVISGAILAFIKNQQRAREEAEKLSKAWTQAATDIYAQSAEKFGLTVTTIDSVILAMQRLGREMDYFKEHAFEKLPSLITPEEAAKMSEGSMVALEHKRLEPIVEALKKEQELYEASRQSQIARIRDAAKAAGLIKQNYQNEQEEMAAVNKFINESLADMKEKKGLWAEGVGGLMTDKGNIGTILRSVASSLSGTDLENYNKGLQEVIKSFSDYVGIEAEHLKNADIRIRAENTYIDVMDRLKEVINSSGTAMSDVFNEEFMKISSLMTPEKEREFTNSFEGKMKQLTELRIKADMAKKAVALGMYDTLTDTATITQEVVQMNADGIAEIVTTTEKVRVDLLTNNVANLEVALAEELRIWREAEEAKWGLSVDGILAAKEFQKMEAEEFENTMQKEIRQYQEAADKIKRAAGLSAKDLQYIEAKEQAGIGAIRKKYFDKFTNEMQMDLVKRGDNEFAIEKENIDKRIEALKKDYVWASKELMEQHAKDMMTAFAQTSNKEFFDKNKEEYLEQIATLGMDEYQIKQYNIERELKLRLDALEKQKQMNEQYGQQFKEYEELKVLAVEAANAQIMKNQNERMEEEAKLWNETIDSMLGDFKKLFTESINSEWKGFGEYFEQLCDRLRNTFLDMIVEMVAGWIGGMVKMKAASFMMSATTGATQGALNYPTSGAGSLSTAGGTATSAGMGGFMQKAGMMILNQKLGKSMMPTLISKIPGIGSILTSTSYVSVGGVSVPASSAAAAGSIMPGTPYAGVAATQAAQTTGPAYFAPGALTLGAASLVGGVTGGLVGGNFAQSRGKGAGMAMSGGVGAATGAGVYGGLWAAGMAGGPWGLAAAAILSAVSAMVGGGLFSADPTKRKRQARGREFGTGLKSWGEGEYDSLSQMMGQAPGAIFSSKALYAAQHYLGPNVPHSKIAFGVQEGLRGMRDTFEGIGALSPAVASSMDLLTTQLDAYVTQVGRDFPKSAGQMEELRTKMLGLFKEDVQQQFARGIISIKSLRDQLQDLGLEDAETQSQMFEQAVSNLFNETLPYGTVQLEDLYSGITELKEDMDETAAAVKGFEIITSALGQGFELTGRQLELFRENADNLAMLQNVDLYMQMGMDKIPLAEKHIEDFDDVIEEMRLSVDKTQKSIEQFNYFIDALPQGLDDVRKALQAVSYTMQYISEIADAAIDVMENIGNFEEIMAGFKEAVSAGDIGAVIDSMNEFAGVIADVLDLTTRLGGAFDQLGFSGVAAAFDGLNKGLSKFLMVIQIINTVLMLIRLFREWQATMIDTADAIAEARDKMDVWTKWKENFYKHFVKPWIEAGRTILNILGWIMTLGKQTDWGDIWATGQELRWEDILNLGEAEQTFLDIQDLFWSTGQIGRETWAQMTSDMYTFLRTIDEGQAVIDAEALAVEAARYFEYMYQNWDTLVQQFGSADAVGDIIEQAADYYAQKLAELVDAAVEAWTEFGEAIQNEINTMDTEIVSLLARAGKLSEARTFGLTGPAGEVPGTLSDLTITVPAFTPVSDEVAEFIKWTSEAARIADLSAQAWQDYTNAATPEEALEHLTEVKDYLLQQMDAELSAIDAYYSEQERLIREKYDLENQNLEDQINLLEEMQDRYESFKETADELIKDVRMGGSSDAEQFNAARKEVNRIEDAITLATTPEEKMDLYDDLLEAYEQLWSSGQNLYQEDWEAYKRLQDEVISGVEEAKENGSQFYETEIAAIQALIDAVLQGQTYEEYTADNTKAMEEELELLYQARAEDKAELIQGYRDIMEDLGIVVGNESEDIADAIYAAFEAMFQSYIDWSAASGGETWWLSLMSATLTSILTQAELIAGGLPGGDDDDGGGGTGAYQLPPGTGAWWNLPAAEPIDVAADLQEVMNAMITEMENRGTYNWTEMETVYAMQDAFTAAISDGITTADLPFFEDLYNLIALMGDDFMSLVPGVEMEQDAWEVLRQILEDLRAGGTPPTDVVPTVDIESIRYVFDVYGRMMEELISRGDVSSPEFIDIAAEWKTLQDILADNAISTDELEDLEYILSSFKDQNQKYIDMGILTTGDAMGVFIVLTQAINELTDAINTSNGNLPQGNDYYAIEDWAKPEFWGAAKIDRVDLASDVNEVLQGIIAEARDNGVTGWANLLETQRLAFQSAYPGGITTLEEGNVIMDLMGFLNDFGSQISDLIPSSMMETDFYNVLNQLAEAAESLGALGSMQEGGYIPKTGLYKLHEGEEVHSPYTTGMYGLNSSDQYSIPNTNPFPYDYRIPDTNSKDKETVFVFVPFQTSPQEQERIFQDVKQRMKRVSRNEQFIYDKAIIKTNRGV
jgi:TP901 family phage tail tape measure protein